MPPAANTPQSTLRLSAPQLALYHSGNERNLFSGGQGSGKTHCLGLLSYMYAFNFPKAIQLIGANTNSQLIKSTLKRVYDVWALMGLKKNVHYVVNIRPPKHFNQVHPELDSYDHVITFQNGAMLFTASLENYTAIDGIEIAVAHLDETKDTREEAVKEVIIGRLRQIAIWKLPDGRLIDYAAEGSIGFNPLYVYTSPAKSPWLADFFGLTEKLDEVERVIYSADTFFHMNDTANNRTVVISSTYHNQHNLPANYIPNLLNDLKGRPHLVNMLVYGSPVAKSGGEYLNCFDRGTHVKHLTPEQKLDTSLPIHITFDFNVKPYMTAQVWQIHRKSDYHIIVRCVKEYALEHPRNTTEDICSAIMTDYGNHRAGALYYGDASGNNQNTISKDQRHNYSVIEKHLRPLLTDFSKRVLKSNPSHLRRRDFLNKIFAGGTFEGTLVEIEISSECPKLIADCQFVMETVDGHMEKKKVTDKDTGQTYEKYGHQLDAMVYFICSAFKSFFNG